MPCPACESRYQLQPHEGASGTLKSRATVALATAPPSVRFNPTRVHLEPRSTGSCARGASPLQPHEGASGTETGEPTEADPDPDEICFNPTRVHLEHPDEVFDASDRDTLQPHEGASGTPVDSSLLRQIPGASTPRGCIWNSERSQFRTIRTRGFNPTRVHLERGNDRNVGTTVHKLQPHEGASGTAPNRPGERP